MYEESYLSECELAKWKNKKIFRTNAEHTQTIDMHNYTEVINENYQQGDLKVSAELSGCDNLEISFDGTYKLKDFSAKSITDKRITFLKFLSENTVFSKELNVVQTYYLTHEPNKYVEKENLSFNIFTDKGKNEITFRLVLHKYNNQKQKENWEVTTRAK